MTQQGLQRLRMRPIFDVALHVSGQAVLARMKEKLREPGVPVEGAVLPSGAELTTHEDDAHFWSPCLSVEVKETDGAWTLRGRFAPDPNVWILFMGVYGIIVMAGVAALMFGVSQMFLGQPPWALWGVPASAALFAFVYGAAFIGQGLGNEEMYVLRSFVDAAIHEVTEHGLGAAPPVSSPGNSTRS